MDTSTFLAIRTAWLSLMALISTSTPTPAKARTGLGHARLQLRRNEVQNYLISNALFWLDNITSRLSC